MTPPLQDIHIGQMAASREVLNRGSISSLFSGGPLDLEISHDTNVTYYSNGLPCIYRAPDPPSEAILSRARKILVSLYNIDAQFKSTEQRLALEWILHGETPLVVVIPTGGGKSLLFEGPASEHGAKTTIVIVPFVALRGQLHHRALCAGITSQEWSRNVHEQTSIVFVTVEGSITKEFKLFAKTLAIGNKLARVVIDEAHLMLISSTFRGAYHHLDWFSSIGVQCIFLTATLPVEMEQSLYFAAFIKNARVIRARTNRPNIAYKVYKTATDKLLRKALHEISLFKAGRKGSRAKAIVYTRSINDCQGVAAHLSCGMYFAEYEGKEQDLTNWIYGDESVIVATTALGAGIDVGSISLVMHYKSPYMLFEVAQGSGRAGRDGQPAQSITLITEGRLKGTAKSEFPQDQKALNAYLSTKGCRRAELNAYFDGQRINCDPMVDALCDNCHRSRSAVNRATPSPGEVRADINLSLSESSVGDSGDECRESQPVLNRQTGGYNVRFPRNNVSSKQPQRTTRPSVSYNSTGTSVAGLLAFESLRNIPKALLASSQTPKEPESPRNHNANCKELTNVGNYTAVPQRTESLFKPQPAAIDPVKHLKRRQSFSVDIRKPPLDTSRALVSYATLAKRKKPEMSTEKPKIIKTSKTLGPSTNVPLAVKGVSLGQGKIKYPIGLHLTTSDDSDELPSIRRNLESTLKSTDSWEEVTPPSKRRKLKTPVIELTKRKSNQIDLPKPQIISKKPRLWAGLGREVHVKLPDIDGPIHPQHCNRVNIDSTGTTTEDLCERLLVSVFGHNSEYRSKEQALGLRAVLGGKHLVVLVLPPSGGKSLLMFAPSKLLGARVTIVILSCDLLLDKMIQRSTKYGVQARRWAPEKNNDCHLLLTTFQEATTIDFNNYIRASSEKGSLERIIFDECHMLVNNGVFRSFYKQIDWVKSIDAQRVYITSTLPPYMEGRLKDLTGIPEALTIRGCSVSKNVRNIIHRVSNPRAATISVVKSYKLVGQDKIIVYCPKADVNCIADILKCARYYNGYARSNTELKAWFQGIEKVIVATTALGVRLNMPSVVAVVHCGLTYSLTDYHQESGWAGGDGRLVTSYLYYSERDIHRTCTGEDEQALVNFARGNGCRREFLGNYFDGTGEGTPCRKSGSQPCDNCVRSVPWNMPLSSSSVSISASFHSSSQLGSTILSLDTPRSTNPAIKGCH